MKIRIFKQDGLYEYKKTEGNSVFYETSVGRLRRLNLYDKGIEWEFVGPVDDSDEQPELPPEPSFAPPSLDIFHENETEEEKIDFDKELENLVESENAEFEPIDEAENSEEEA